MLPSELAQEVVFDDVLPLGKPFAVTVMPPSAFHGPSRDVHEQTGAGIRVSLTKMKYELVRKLASHDVVALPASVGVAVHLLNVGAKRR